MSVMLSVKVDLSKINQSKVFVTDAGRKYYEFTVAIDDETKVHTFPNGQQKFSNVNCWEAQDKEERSNPKNYLGDGQVFWTSEGASGTVNVVDREATGDDAKPQEAQSTNEGDLPF